MAKEKATTGAVIDVAVPRNLMSALSHATGILEERLELREPGELLMRESLSSGDLKTIIAKLDSAGRNDVLERIAYDRHPNSLPIRRPKDQAETIFVEGSSL